MDESVPVVQLEELIQAILNVYDPATSNADRLKCTQIIENFKEGPAYDVANKAVKLTSHGSASLRHTGWTLLEDLIRYKWNSVGAELCLELRNQVFNAIATHVPEDAVESCARSVVAMMEHEWPQNWLELNSQLQELCLQSSLHCAIVFAIQRRLVENVATLASISNLRRRREMHGAMVESVNDFVALGLNKMNSCNIGSSTDLLALKNIFGWLIEICSCVGSACIEHHLNRIIDTAILFLRTEEGNIYELSAQCLATLATCKKEKRDETMVISAFFREHVFVKLLDVACDVADGFTDTRYRYLKSLCEVLTTLGNFLSKVWTERLPPPSFRTFILAIVSFFKHESLYLKYEACDVLVMLSTHSLFHKDGAMVEALSGVFTDVVTSFYKKGYPSELSTQNATKACVYAIMDFRDDLEWHNFFIRFRSRLQLLIQENIDVHLDLLCDEYEAMISHVLAEATQVSCHQWEAYQKFSRCLITAAYEKKVFEKAKTRLISVRDTLVNAMRSICLRAMDEAGACDIISQMLSVLSPFLPSYDDDWENFTNYFDLLKRALSVSGGNKTLTRHATSLVLLAVQHLPLYFKQRTECVITMYDELNGVITKMQMAQLLQVLAVLSNIVEGETAKVGLLHMAVDYSVVHISSIAWSFTNVSSFIHFNALDVAPSISEEAVCLNRMELRRTLAVFQGVLQQVEKRSPLGPILSPVFPLFFKLTRCLMDLHSERASRLLHPQHRDSITRIPFFERQQIYCSVGESIEGVVGDSETTGKDMASIERQYVYDVFDQVNSVIALSMSKCASETFAISDISEMLSDTVANIDSIPEFRVRNWIKKGWRFMICECPPEHYDSIKSVFLRIVGNMHTRLEKMWAEVCHTDYDAEPSEEQLFFEHLTCVLSRDYIGFLRSCYVTGEGEDRKALAMSPLGEWLFDNRIGLSFVIMTTFSSLTFRDSTLALRSIGLCRIFAEKLAKCYDDEVAVYMLVSSIRSLQIHGADEVAMTPLMLLVIHIYLVLRPFSDSFPRVLVQAPNVSADKVEEFDSNIQEAISNDGVILEKQKKEMARKLLKGVITPTIGEQYKKPVHLRPLPPIEKRRPILNEEPDYFEEIALFFACED